MVVKGIMKPRTPRSVGFPNQWVSSLHITWNGAIPSRLERSPLAWEGWKKSLSYCSELNCNVTWRDKSLAWLLTVLSPAMLFADMIPEETASLQLQLSWEWRSNREDVWRYQKRELKSFKFSINWKLYWLISRSCTRVVYPSHVLPRAEVRNLIGASPRPILRINAWSISAQHFTYRTLRFWLKTGC